MLYLISFSNNFVSNKKFDDGGLYRTIEHEHVDRPYLLVLPISSLNRGTDHQREEQSKQPFTFEYHQEPEYQQQREEKDKQPIYYLEPLYKNEQTYQPQIEEIQPTYYYREESEQKQEPNSYVQQIPSYKLAEFVKSSYPLISESAYKTEPEPTYITKQPTYIRPLSHKKTAPAKETVYETPIYRPAVQEYKESPSYTKETKYEAPKDTYVAKEPVIKTDLSARPTGKLSFIIQRKPNSRPLLLTVV